MRTSRMTPPPVAVARDTTVARDAGLHLLNALGDLGHCEVLVAIVDRLELAPVDCNDSPREKVELTAQHDELRARRADRRPAVAAEVGDRLEVRHQSAGQPHRSMLRWLSRSSRRLDWMRLR